jgi:hypothetical protein
MSVGFDLLDYVPYRVSAVSNLLAFDRDPDIQEVADMALRNSARSWTLAPPAAQGRGHRPAVAHEQDCKKLVDMLLKLEVMAELLLADHAEGAARHGKRLSRDQRDLIRWARGRQG